MIIGNEFDAVHVDIWQWNLDLPVGDRAAAAAVLSDDERVRGARMAAPHLTSRFVAARAGLRRHLGLCIAQPPEQLVFRYGAHGKPVLDGAAGHVPLFNLSHSADLAALAVCWDHDVGIDIERIQAFPEDVASFFAVGERAALAALQGRAAVEAFFRCWTRKEAVAKALGSGLALPFDQFEVSIDPESPRVLSIYGDAVAAKAWHLRQFEPVLGMMGALAVRCGRSSLSVAHHR